MKKLTIILLLFAGLFLSSCENITDAYIPLSDTKITLAEQNLFDKSADTMLVYVTDATTLNSQLIIGTLDHKILYIEKKPATSALAFANLFIGIAIGILLGFFFAWVFDHS